MSIEQADVIDAIGVDKETGQVVLENGKLGSGLIFEGGSRGWSHFAMGFSKCIFDNF